MKTKKGKDNTVVHTAKLTNKKDKVSSEDKRYFFSKENKIPHQTSFEHNGFEISFAGLGQELRGQGSVLGETIKSGVRESSKDFLGKKTKGNSTVQSLEIIPRADESKRGFIDRKEHDRIMSSFRDEFALIIKESEGECTSSQEFLKHETNINLESEVKSFSLKKISKTKETFTNKSIKENQEESSDFQGVSTERLLAEKNLSEKYTNDETNSLNLLHKTNKHINQNFMHYYKNIFDNLKIVTYKTCKSIESFLSNNTNNFHILSNKYFLENLDKKFSEMFTVENQTINFTDNQFHNSSEKNNQFPTLLKNINDFHNYDITSSKVFEIFENITEKLDQSYEKNKNPKCSKVDNENNNFLKNFFNKKFTYKRNPSGCFQIRYRRQRKYFKDCNNKKLNRVFMKKQNDCVIKNDKNQHNLKDENDCLKEVSQLSLNEDSSYLSDEILLQKENKNCLNSSQSLESISIEESEIEEGNKQNDRFLEEDFCLTDLNWRGVSNSKLMKLIPQKEIEALMFESTEAPTNIKNDKEELKLFENNQAIETKLSLFKQYENYAKEDEDLLIPCKITDGKNIIPTIINNFFFLPSQEKLIILDNIEQVSKFDEPNMVFNCFENDTLMNGLAGRKPRNDDNIQDKGELKENNIIKVKVNEDAVLDPINNQKVTDNFIIEKIKENEVQATPIDQIFSLDDSKENIDFQIDIENEVDLLNNLSTNPVANNDKIFEMREEKNEKDQMNMISDNNIVQNNHFKIYLTNREQETRGNKRVELIDPIQANNSKQIKEFEDLYSKESNNLECIKKCLSDNDNREAPRCNIIKIPKVDVNCASGPHTTKEKNSNLVRDKLENLSKKEKLTYRNLIIKKIRYLRKKQKKNLDLKMLQDSYIIKSLIYMNNRKLSSKFIQKDKKLENSLFYILEKLEKIEIKNLNITVAKNYKDEVNNEMNGFLNIEENKDCKLSQYLRLKTLLLNKSLNDNFSLTHFTNNFKDSLNLNKYFYQKNVNNCFKNKNSRNKEDLNTEIFDLDEILNPQAAKEIQVSEDNKFLQNETTINLQKVDKLDNNKNRICDANGDDFFNAKKLENGVKYFLHNLDNLSILSENMIKKDHSTLAYLDLLKIVYCLDNQDENKDYNLFSNNFSLDNLIANNKKINCFIEKIVKYADQSRKYSTGKSLKKLLNANLKETEAMNNPITRSEGGTQERKFKFFFDNFSEDNYFMNNKENKLTLNEDIQMKNKELKKRRTRSKNQSDIIEIRNFASYESANDYKAKENLIECKFISNHNVNNSLITLSSVKNSGALNAGDNLAMNNLNFTDKNTANPIKEKKNSFIISKVRSNKKTNSTVANQNEIFNNPNQQQSFNSNKTHNIIISFENNSYQKSNHELDVIPRVVEDETRDEKENENIFDDYFENDKFNNKGTHINKINKNESELTLQKKYDNIFNAIEELTDNDSKIFNHENVSNSQLSDSETNQKFKIINNLINFSNKDDNDFIETNNSKKYSNIIKIDTGIFDFLDIQKNLDKEDKNNSITFKDTKEKKRVKNNGRKRNTNTRKKVNKNGVQCDVKIDSSKPHESKDLQMESNNKNNNSKIIPSATDDVCENVVKNPLENLTSINRESNENQEIRISFSKNKSCNFISSINNHHSMINNFIPKSNESTIKPEEEPLKHINISFLNKKANLEISGLSKNHKADSFDEDKNKFNFNTDPNYKSIDSNDFQKYTNNTNIIKKSFNEKKNFTRIDNILEEKIKDSNTELQKIQNSKTYQLTRNLPISSLWEKSNSIQGIKAKLETPTESINDILKQSLDKHENKPDKPNIFTSNKGAIQEKQKDTKEKMDSENLISSHEKTKDDTYFKTNNTKNLSSKFSKESIFNNSENTTNLFNAFTKDLSKMKLNLNLNLNVNLNVNVKSKSENKKANSQNEKEKSSKKRDLSNHMNQTSNSYVDMVNKTTCSSKIPIANNYTNIFNNNTTNNFIITSPPGPLDTNKIINYSVLSGFNNGNNTTNERNDDDKSELKNRQINNTFDYIINKNNYVESHSGINAQLNPNTGDPYNSTISMLGIKRHKESLISDMENQMSLQQKINSSLLEASSAPYLKKVNFKNSDQKNISKSDFSYQNHNNHIKASKNNTIFESGFINNNTNTNFSLKENFNSKILNNSILRNILTDKLKDLEENVILKNINPELSASKFNEKENENKNTIGESKQINTKLEELYIKKREEDEEKTKTVTDTCSDTEVENEGIIVDNYSKISSNNPAILKESKLSANKSLNFNNNVQINKNDIKDKNSKGFVQVSSINKINDILQMDAFNNFSCKINEASLFGKTKNESFTSDFNTTSSRGAPTENIFLANLVKNKDSTLSQKSDFASISKDKRNENAKSYISNNSIKTNKESQNIGFTKDKNKEFSSYEKKDFNLKDENPKAPKVPCIRETKDNLGFNYKTNNIINNTFNNNFYNRTDNFNFIQNQTTATKSIYDNQILKYSNNTFSNEISKSNISDQARRGVNDFLNYKGHCNSHINNKDFNNLAFSNSIISNNKCTNNEILNKKIDNTKLVQYDNNIINNIFNNTNKPSNRIAFNSNSNASEVYPNKNIETHDFQSKYIQLFSNLNSNIQKNSAILKDQEKTKKNTGFNLDDFFVKDN